MRGCSIAKPTLKWNVFGIKMQISSLPSAFTGYAFELLVSSWLANILRGESDVPEELTSSGFLAAVRNDRIAAQAAA